MSQQNKREKNKKSTSGDTVGVVLIIVAAFFLVCLCTPILSDIGAPIKNLLTGLFGFFSYAAFVIMLVSGVLILRKSKLLVQKKWAVYTILSFVFFVCVLQLITSSKFFGKGVGEYISAVYDHDSAKTIGGIVFGIFVYAAQAALSKVGAYLFFGLLLALFLFMLGYDIYRIQKPVPPSRRNYKHDNGKISKNGKKPPVGSSATFVRSGAEAAPLRPVQNQGLFVASIVPRDERATSETGSFSGFVNHPQEKVTSDSLGKLNNYFATIKQSAAQSTAGAAPDAELQRQNARQILFEDTQRMNDQSARDFLSKSNQHKDIARDILSQGASARPVQPPKASARPDIHEERPEDIPARFVKAEPKLPEVVFPPPKEDAPRFVDGEIIDGAVVSSQLKSMDKPKKFEPDYRSMVDEDYGFEPEDDKANDYLSQTQVQRYDNFDNNFDDNFGNGFDDNSDGQNNHATGSYGNFSPTLAARRVSKPDIKGVEDWNSGYNPSEIINCDDIAGEDNLPAQTSVTSVPPVAQFQHDCYELPADLGVESDLDSDFSNEMEYDDNFDSDIPESFAHRGFEDNADTPAPNIFGGFVSEPARQGANNTLDNAQSYSDNYANNTAENYADNAANNYTGEYADNAAENYADNADESNTRYSNDFADGDEYNYSYNTAQNYADSSDENAIELPRTDTAPALTAKITSTFDYSDVRQEIEFEEESAQYSKPARPATPQNSYTGDLQEFRRGTEDRHSTTDGFSPIADSVQDTDFLQDNDEQTADDFVAPAPQQPVSPIQPQPASPVLQQPVAPVQKKTDDYPKLQPIASMTFGNQGETGEQAQKTAQDTNDDVFPDEDYTGQYIKQKKTEAFSKRAEELNKKIDPKNQINIESYIATAAAQAPETKKPKRRKNSRYMPPLSELLTSQSTDPEDYNQDFQTNAATLEETLKSLKLPAKVIGITKGPAVTRYELEMPPGYTVKKIEGFSQDIAYALASTGGIRIEAPIPGKRAVGVEVPNSSIGIVGLRDMIESQEFAKSASYLSLCVGKDIAGKPVVCSLDKMPHLLVAGSTGSGKSACLHSLIISMLFKASPSELRLILIDPKRVEFPFYKGLRHLMINNIINEREHAINAFKWVREEMTERYRLLAKFNSRNLQEYNSCAAVKSGEAEKLPSIVIIVDELSDLMQGGYKKEMEEHILSIAQLARASGVHLILATQRPSVDVITGTIKVNLPSRIALAVSNAMDSKTILDQSGAEMLLGRGDLLFAPMDAPDAKRIQGAYVTKEEVEAIVEFINDNNPEDFYDEAEEKIMRTKEVVEERETDSSEEEGHDPLLEEVARKVIETNQASTSMMQRRFKLGYARASRIVDQMEMLNFIGPLDPNRPNKPRDIFINREMFKEFFGKDF